MDKKRGWTIRKLIKELEKVPEKDKDKMIWQKLDFYMGGINFISIGENGDYILNEFTGEESNKLEYINKFLDKVKEKYPNIIFKYKYEDGNYTITHNYANDLDDKDWNICIENLMNDNIFKNEINNFSFYCNYGLKDD